MKDFDPWEEYEHSINKEAGFKAIPNCDHYDENTKTWCQEVGAPTEIGDYPSHWGVAGMFDNGPYEACAFCPKHAPLHCLDDWEKEKSGCGGNNLGRYNQCIDCEGDDKQYAKENKIVDEHIIKDYRDAFGFDKEAINYFSLDQPNQAIMPGMAQEDPANDGLGFGSVGNPDSGMEDNVTQDFPGMHDYERGLSSAASKFNKIAYYERITHCDGCDKRSPDEDENLPRGWAKASGAKAGTAEYNHNNDEHYCEDCKKDRCLDQWDGYTIKNIGCGNKIGKYGQCTGCDRTDDQYLQEYIDVWEKNAHYEYLKMDQDDPWVQVKQATTYVHCDNCDDAIQAEYVKPLSHPGWYGLENLNFSPHYCSNCMKKRCHECGETLGSYGQCPQCKGTDEDIKKDYEDAWEFNKNASYLRYGPTGEEEDLQCDHQGCNELVQDQGYHEDLPDGWSMGGEGDENFCPKHSEKHCASVYDKDEDKEYYGCGELLQGTHCPNSVTDKECFENEQYRLIKKKKRDQDAWRFDKKASLDNPWVSPILVLADQKTVHFTITTCDDCGKKVTEKHKNHYYYNKEKTTNWEFENNKTKCPDCALKFNKNYFGASGTNENSIGWKPIQVKNNENYPQDKYFENMTMPKFKKFENPFSAYENMIIVSPDDTETKHITSNFIANKNNPEKTKLITTIHGYTPSRGNINATKRDIVSHLRTLAPDSKDSIFSTPVSHLSKKDLKSLYIGNDLTNGLVSDNQSVYTDWQRQIWPISYFNQHINENYESRYGQLENKRTKYNTESIHTLDLDKNGQHKGGDSWSIRLIHNIKPGNFDQQLKEANDKHQAIRKLISSNPDATFQDKLVNRTIDYQNAWGFDDDDDNKTVTAGLKYRKIRIISCDGCNKEIEDKQSPYSYRYKKIDKSAPGWEFSDWGKFICPDCKKNENPRYMEKSKDFKDLGWEEGKYRNDTYYQYQKRTLDPTKTKIIISTFKPNPYNAKPEITTKILGYSEGNSTKHKKDIVSHLKSLYPNNDHPIFSTAPSKLKKSDFEDELDLNNKSGYATWYKQYDYMAHQKYNINIDNNKNLYGYSNESMSKIGPGSAFEIMKKTSMPASNRLEKHIKAADVIHQGIVDAISSNPDCTYQDRLQNNVNKYKEAWDFNA